MAAQRVEFSDLIANLVALFSTDLSFPIRRFGVRRNFRQRRAASRKLPDAAPHFDQNPVRRGKFQKPVGVNVLHVTGFASRNLSPLFDVVGPPRLIFLDLGRSLAHFPRKHFLNRLLGFVGDIVEDNRNLKGIGDVMNKEDKNQNAADGENEPA